MRVKLASLLIDGVAIKSLAAGPWMFEAPADLAPGTHTIEIKATDGANETIAMIEITVPGADDERTDDDKFSLGCSAGGGGNSGWLLGLLLLGLRRSRSRPGRAQVEVSALRSRRAPLHNFQELPNVRVALL